MARSLRSIPVVQAMAAVLLLLLAGCGAGLATTLGASGGGGGAAESRPPELSVLTAPLPLVPPAGRTARVLISEADLSGETSLEVVLRADGRQALQQILTISVQNNATTITVLLDTAPLRAGVDPTSSDVAAQFEVRVAGSAIADPAAVLLVRQPVAELVVPSGAGLLKVSPLGGFVTMTVDGLLATDVGDLSVIVGTRDPQSIDPRVRTVRLATELSFEPSVNGLPTLRALVPGNDFPDQIEILVQDAVAGVSTVVSNAIYEPRIEFALPGQGPTTGGSLVTLIGKALVPYDFSSLPAQLDFDSITLSFEKGGRVTELPAQDFRAADSSLDRLVFTIPPSPDGRPGRVTIRLQVVALRADGSTFTATFAADEEFLYANPDPFFGPRGAVLDETPVAAVPIRLDSAPSSDAAPDFAILTEQGGVGFLQLLLAQQNGMFQPFATPQQVGNHQLDPQRNPRDLLVGDFNGDGVPDLFVVNEGGLTAEHMLVLGQTRPDPPLGDVEAVAAPPGSNSGRVADFDGDGLPDIVLVPGPQAPVGQRPHVLFATGLPQGPRFAPPVALDVREFAFEAYEIADLNDDGLIDLAFVSGTGLKIDVVYGTGSRTFAAGDPLDFEVPGYTASPDSPAVGLHSCRNGPRPSLGLVLAGAEASTSARPTVAVLPQQLVAGVWTFRAPTPAEVYTAPVEPIGQTLAADLDRGQAPGGSPVELVLGIRGEPTSVSLGLLQFNGTRFVPLLGSIIAGTAGLAEAPVQIRELAFDAAFPTAGPGQQQKDAVFLVHEVDVDGVREKRLSTRLVDVPEVGAPILLPPDAGAILAFPIEGLVVGDFSDAAVGAQGRARDLALARSAIPGQSAGVTIVLNDGFGGIPRLGVRLDASGLLPKAVALLGSSAGYDRLVFINRDSSVGFWFPDPDGSTQQFTSAMSAPLRQLLGPAYAAAELRDDTRIQVGDVNGDGIPDLVVMMVFDVGAGSASEARLALLIGKPVADPAAFPFLEPVELTDVHGNASALALGDFAPGPPGVPTSLEVAVTVPVGASPSAVDGNHIVFFRVDDSVAGGLARLVRSYAGSSEQALLAGSGPSEVVAADFDADGRQDLLVACRGDNTLRVFRNTFTPGGSVGEVDVGAFVEGLSSPYALAPGVPTALSLSDVNGDGSPDAVAFVEQTLLTGARQSTIAVYLSSGVGSFDSARFVSRTRSGDYDAALSGALGDWNRDGVPDLLIGWGLLEQSVNLRVLFGGTR